MAWCVCQPFCVQSSFYWALASRQRLSTSQVTSSHCSVLGAPLDPTYLLREQAEPPFGGSTHFKRDGLALLTLAGWKQEPVSCPGMDMVLKKGSAFSVVLARKDPGDWWPDPTLEASSHGQAHLAGSWREACGPQPICPLLAFCVPRPPLSLPASLELCEGPESRADMKRPLA